MVRQGGLKSQLRYKTHRAVDDAHEVITAVETTTGAVDEATQLLGLIEAHQDTTGHTVRTVIADARYGNVSNLIGCQKARIRAHVKLLGESIRGKGRSEGIYDEEQFIYDASSNTYRCPADQIMKPRRLHLQRLTCLPQKDTKTDGLNRRKRRQQRLKTCRRWEGNRTGLSSVSSCSKGLSSCPLWPSV